MKRMLTAIVCLLVGVSLLSSAGATAGEKEKLIGICLPGATHGWVAAVAYFAENEAKDLGLNYYLVTSANPNEQANQIDDLIGLGCDTIVLFPHNNEIDVAAQKILDSGIKLVNFDRKVAVDSTCYLAGDNPGIGVSGARYIGEKLGGKGDIVLVHVPANGSIDVERVEACKATLAKEFPEIRIIGDYGASFTGSREDGLRAMTDVLTANPHIDGVFSMDDELSLGILQAIEDAGRTDIKVLTGGGGAQEYFRAIKDTPSINISSALYSPAMIRDAVDIAKKISDGVAVDQQIIIPATIVDKTNVDQYLDANSPY